MGASQERDSAVHAIAGRQLGLITRRQAHVVGMSPKMVRHRCSSAWQQLAPGVFLLAGAPCTWETKVFAACLAVDGVASHRTAAALYELDGCRPGRVEVTAERGGPGSQVLIDGVTIHRSTDFHLVVPRRVSGVPTTAPARLAVDLGATIPFRRYERAVDELIARRMLSWDEALDALFSHGRRGRNGVGALRALLSERYGTEVPESALERAFLRLLRSSGLPEPVLQLSIGDDHGFIARVDFAFPDQRVVIELDGVRWHLNAQTFEADHAKRARLQANGWQVLAFTWRMVLDDPEGVIRTVRSALSLAR